MLSLAAGAAAISLATFAAYLPALRAGFVWDDDDYVTENPCLASPAGLARIWVPGDTPQYYPLTFTSFWVERRIWGIDPRGYHAVNIALHAANALLLWRLLRRLGVRGAWLAGAVFALHPVQAESVAWVAERKNVLSGFWYLLAAGSYLSYAEGAGRGSYLCSFGLFLLALLSKTTAATLPLALLAVAWWRGGRIRARDLVPLLPFAAAGAAAGAVTWRLEASRVGAAGPEWAFSMGQRAVIAGRALWFYAARIFFPFRLSFVYPRWEAAGDWRAWGWPAAAALLLLSLYLFRSRIGRGPFAGAAFFAATLLPALGFVNFYPMRFSFVADHFQYLACAGIIALAASGAASAAGRRRGSGAAAALLLLVLGALTARRALAFADGEALWRDTLAKNPSAWIARYNLAVILMEEKRHAEAAAELEAFLRLKPDSEKAYDAHDDLGVAYRSLGRTKDALREFAAARDRRPGSAEAHYRLGALYAETGRHEEAERECREALRIDGDHAGALVGLAAILGKTGRYGEAERLLARAAAARPDSAGARYNLAVLYRKTGQTEKARAELDALRRLDPGLAGALEGADGLRACGIITRQRRQGGTRSP